MLISFFNLGISLEDTDERALGYLAGKFPNEEGYLSNGKLVAEEVFGSTELVGHRKSKLFSKGVLAIIHEVLLQYTFCHMSVISNFTRL